MGKPLSRKVNLKWEPFFRAKGEWGVPRVFRERPLNQDPFGLNLPDRGKTPRIKVPRIICQTHC